MFAPARAYVQRAALIHFDDRAVREAKNGVRVARGPHSVALNQFCARG